MNIEQYINKMLSMLFNLTCSEYANQDLKANIIYYSYDNINISIEDEKSINYILDINLKHKANLNNEAIGFLTKKLYENVDLIYEKFNDVTNLNIKLTDTVETRTILNDNNIVIDKDINISFKSEYNKQRSKITAFEIID